MSVYPGCLQCPQDGNGGKGARGKGAKGAGNAVPTNSTQSGSRKRKQPAGSNSEQAGSPAQAGTPSQNTMGEQAQANQPWQQSNLRMASNARGEFPFLDGSHDGSLGGAQPRDSLNNGLLDQLDNHMEELLGADFAGGNLDVHADALLGGGDDAPLADSLLGALQVPGGGK